MVWQPPVKGLQHQIQSKSERKYPLGHSKLASNTTKRSATKVALHPGAHDDEEKPHYGKSYSHPEFPTAQYHIYHPPRSECCIASSGLALIRVPRPSLGYSLHFGRRWLALDFYDTPQHLSQL